MCKIEKYHLWKITVVFSIKKNNAHYEIADFYISANVNNVKVLIKIQIV